MLEGAGGITSPPVKQTKKRTHMGKEEEGDKTSVDDTQKVNKAQSP